MVVGSHFSPSPSSLSLDLWSLSLSLASHPPLFPHSSSPSFLSLSSLSSSLFLPLCFVSLLIWLIGGYLRGYRSLDVRMTGWTWIGRGRGFPFDGWIMHNIMSLWQGGMFTLTRDGAEIYFWCFWFQTPLHLAARYGKGDVMEILLRNGANVNEKRVKYIQLEKQLIERERGSR